MSKNYPYQVTTYDEYQSAYEKSIADPEAFWGEVASHFTWRKKWDTVLEWNFREPKVEWFKGGKLNITENCLDRHVATNGDRTALIWEPNSPDEYYRRISYKELFDDVNRFAWVLKNNGVKKGDTVCIYMGMIPELATAVLACARIGAIHSVIFAGFSAQSISDRVQDAHAKFIVTCDGAYRGQKDIPLKSVIDEAVATCPFVEKIIVCKRTGIAVDMKAGRDAWWEDEVKASEANEQDFCEPEEMDAEDPLFILYTSGSTGKPKGVVHTVGGYMIFTSYTFVNTFQYEPGDVFFCTADIGWITGHSYIIYGPLSAGATSMIFEGIPTYPDAGRFWDITDKHQVNILYTAPTAIRSLMSFGTSPLEGKDLSSLKVLGSVGEPINEEAWYWFNENVGKKRCPIVDTWWQTETGGHMITNLAGITPAVPGTATLPMPGVQPCLMDENGKEIHGNNVSGNLAIKAPWPAILRTTYGDHERCRTTYFATYPDMYFTGDGAMRDEDGFYKITGRVDDVLNVSGHRIGTAEVENAINMHGSVIESAIVGYPHDVKGQGIYAYVILEKGAADDDRMRAEISQTVSKIIGPIAKPDKIQFVPGLPKTRSGKIMRRILRKIAEAELSSLGDTSTLLDPGVVEQILAGKL